MDATETEIENICANCGASVRAPATMIGSAIQCQKCQEIFLFRSGLPEESPLIKFTCIHCDQHIEAPRKMLGQEIPCPGCGRRIRARPWVTESEIERLNRQAAKPVKAPDEAEAIHNSAEQTQGFSFFVAIIGGVVLVFALVGGSWTVAGVAGSLISAGFALYLLAQVQFIRAYLRRLVDKK